MIIESMIREHNYCGIVASTHEHIYNAWKRGNNLRFYVLSNTAFDVIYRFFTVRIENGEMRTVIDDVAMTLYSHDELINTVKCAFPDNWYDVTTILETLLYVE